MKTLFVDRMNDDEDDSHLALTTFFNLMLGVD